MSTKLFIAIGCLAATTGCVFDDSARRGLKSSSTASPIQSQEALGNPSRQIKVYLQTGQVRFIGSISEFWPEEFLLNEGQVTTIRLYEKFQPLKSQNNYVDVWVVYSQGVFIFDANPSNWRTTNFGSWFNLGAQPFQRFSNVSITENFSTTEAKNLTITIVKPI